MLERMSEDTPISLLQRLRRNPHEEDWRRLIDVYSPLIKRWLLGFGMSQADADDLSQDVLQAMLREVANFQHNGHSGAFRRWLRTTMVHRLKGFWRNRKTEAQLNGWDAEKILVRMEDPNSDPNLFWDLEHDRFVVHKLLQLVETQFSSTTWKAFCRQLLDGCSAGSVADELGISVNAVLIAKSRVLQALRHEAKGLVELDE
jgi:RNA polymerase sigma-70 factor, ECF subfamily